MRKFGWSIFFVLWAAGCITAAVYFPEQRGVLITFSIVSLAMSVVTFATALFKKDK